MNDNNIIEKYLSDEDKKKGLAFTAKKFLALANVNKVLKEKEELINALKITIAATDHLLSSDAADTLMAELVAHIKEHFTIQKQMTRILAAKEHK